MRVQEDKPERTHAKASPVMTFFFFFLLHNTRGSSFIDVLGTTMFLSDIDSSGEFSNLPVSQALICKLKPRFSAQFTPKALFFFPWLNSFLPLIFSRSTENRDGPLAHTACIECL